ncbi:MAG: hypothetical protein AB1Z19_05810, partial [Eubacteriales bacterium]
MIQSIVIPIAVIILIIVATIIYFGHQKRRREEAVLGAFGEVPSPDAIRMMEITSYHQYKKDQKAAEKLYLDDITWRDLKMDDVFKRICVCQTKTGQEYLFHKLHDVSENTQLAEWMNYLSANDDKREALQKKLWRIGQSQASLADYHFQKKDKDLPFPAILYLILTGTMIALIFSAVVRVFVFQQGAIFLAIGAFCLGLINIFVYYKTKTALEYELERLSYFGSTLYGCKKILDKPYDEMQKQMDSLKSACLVFQRIKGKLSRRSKQMLAELSFLQEYINMIFFIDIHRYRKAVNYIVSNRAPFRKIYETIGCIDTAVSVLSYQKSLSYFCKPNIIDENVIDFKEVYHPLITSPVSNSGRIEQNALITGVNASGKTTFIKTIAINNILALALDTCLAKAYALKRLNVLTSMAIADSILDGDSYYIAEIKSLKRILDIVEKQSCVCFVDEILRGTNTAE